MAIRNPSKAAVALTIVLLPLVVLSALLTLTLPGQAIGQACVTPPGDIIAWWAGDAGAEDSVDGNDGSMENGAVVTSGQVGQAFQFDGVDDHVHIPNTGDNLDGLAQLSIESWINPQSQGWPNPETGGFTSSIVSKYDSRKVDDVSYALTLENGILRMNVYQATTVSTGVLASSSISLTTWSHVAGVWRGEDDFSLYINGAEVPTTPQGQSSVSMADNDTPLNIGRIESFSGLDTDPGPAAFFDGLIDELSIYSRSLSASEIQAIYNAGSSGKCKVDEATPTSTATATATTTATTISGDLYLPAILKFSSTPMPLSRATPLP